MLFFNEESTVVSEPHKHVNPPPWSLTLNFEWYTQFENGYLYLLQCAILIQLFFIQMVWAELLDFYYFVIFVVLNGQL